MLNIHAHNIMQIFDFCKCKKVLTIQSLSHGITTQYIIALFVYFNRGEVISYNLGGSKAELSLSDKTNILTFSPTTAAGWEHVFSGDSIFLLRNIVMRICLNRLLQKQYTIKLLALLATTSKSLTHSRESYSVYHHAYQDLGDQC